MLRPSMDTCGGLSGGIRFAPLYVIRGALFLRTHKVLWKYAAAPTAIGILILGGSYWLLYHLLSGVLYTYSIGAWYQQVLYFSLLVVDIALLSVLFFFVLTRIASALAWPFNDLVSNKTEELVRGNFHETPFSVVQLLKDSARSICHLFKVLGIYLALLIAALFLLLIPGVGEVLYAVAGVLLSAYMFAYEYLGYPMDRRRFTWKEKQAFFRRRFWSIMGFGLGNVLMAAVPVLNLLFIPAAVVGGTLLFLDLSGVTENRPGQAETVER